MIYLHLLEHRLIEIVGATNLHTDIESRRKTVASWSPTDLKIRQTETDNPTHPIPFAVVQPADTSEVSRIIRAANEASVPVLPVGGLSNTTDANHLKSNDTLAVDLSHLQTIDWDEESLLITVGAGWKIAALESALSERGYTIGVLPASANQATIGGAVATNAVGLFSGRYGRFSDIVAALQIVLPNGDILETIKSPMGNLTPLFIGSEGALGIITAATLSIKPLPDVRAWAVFEFDKFETGVDALRLILRTDAVPACLRLLDANAAARIGETIDTNGGFLLFAVEGDELVQTGIYQMAHAVCQKLDGRELPGKIGEKWYDSRDVPDFWKGNARSRTVADVAAVHAKWSRIKPLYLAMRDRLIQETTLLETQICHGDANGAAMEIVYEAATDNDTIESAQRRHRQIIDRIADICHDYGGSVAHHYGIGKIWRDAAIRERPDEWRIRQRISEAVLQ